ncbi:polymorphic toxin-type HINT domain-containing protein [Phytohabitans kaempferiae]|uniref:Polymorphic toxin-type HINT domain-containing protein n=1 Tax=Phytohabitans kaempferiae TaxID=1620943 RepID=A0ABV6M304_9ACTN
MRAVVAAGVTTVVLLGLAQAPATAAKPPAPPAAKDVPDVPVKAVKPQPAPPAAPVKSALDAPDPVWPAAGTAQATLPSAADRRATAAGPTRAGTLPVLVDHPGAGKTAPARVEVRVYDRATTDRAGVRGLLLRVGPSAGERAGGEVAVTVDYRSFRTAFGASWASRLRMYLLPECALSTPDSAACAAKPVASSRNRAGANLVDGAVPTASAAGSLVALMADPSGPSGDFTATSLQPTSSWTAGGNSGAFTWSYPMRVPPVPGNLAPVVQLSYNSQAVDGRHAASNNQPGWAGGGFDLLPGGYIERSYRSCADDKTGGNNSQDTGDLCWATDNAVLNLNGTSNELVKSTGNTWRLRDDDGSRVTRETSAGNGDNDGEWWVVTTTNGTQYWFGRQVLPGRGTNDPVTNSTWTVPVYGNHANEPCHASTFATSHCVQAWRWNLDYVVDLHGNSASYWYTTESNKYGRNGTPSDTVSYIRGGQLAHISYGTRRNGNVDTVFAGTAGAKVIFGPADRCLTNCGTHEDNWPDTPWDQECATTASSCDTTSPTFWTTKRLASVTTQVRNAGGGYDNVDRWTLTHTFPDPGDTTQAGLWLDKLSYQGLVGGTASLPDITFTSLSMDNRVDGIDGIDAMAWHRLVRIDTDTGGAIAVTYSDRDCTAGGAKPAPHNNNRRCYPVRWVPDGQEDPITDWFHKYRVDEVREHDMVAGGRQVLYRYNYLDSPAWHYTDDDGITKRDYKTWSEWRGYGRVGVTTGDPDSDDVLSYTETRYFRGMHGDKQPTGQPARSVNITDSRGGTWRDDDWLAGMTREQIVYNGPGGPEVSSTLKDPFASAPTASRTEFPGTPDEYTVHARFTDVTTIRSRVALDAGRGERVTRVSTTFDGYGQPTQVEDFGEEGVSGDEQCTKSTYEPRNTSAHLVTLVHRAQVFAVNCAATATPASLTEADVISDTRTWYDNPASYGTAPTKGDPTKTEELSTWSSGTPGYVTTAQATYDDHGRVTRTIDANSNATDTSYTPAVGSPVTSTTVTNALGHATTTTLATAWGTTLAVVDPNNKRTDMSYDPLGRLSAVWKPGRTKGTDPANSLFSYDIKKTAPSVLTTRTLSPNGNGPGSTGRYITSHVLHDGLVRPVQTQLASPDDNGGRLLTNTFYDSLGRETETYSAYYNSGAFPTANPQLHVPVEPGQIPTQNRTVYDGAGRIVASVFEPFNTERWRTTTYYAGDRTDVTPPAGGTATSTVVDARGRQTQLWQYPRLTPWNSGDVTTFTYNRKDQLTEVVDPVGNEWTYGYNLRGFKTTETDPDKGTTTSSYDNGGRLTLTIDARNIRLAYRYDALNRKTGVFQNFPLGTPRAFWIYDITDKGQLHAAVRNTGTNANYEIRFPDYTDDYKPERMQVVVPSTETGLAGTYEYEYSYHPNGAVATTTMYQATGTDLATETLHHDYNDLGLPTRLRSTYGTTSLSYVNATHYNALGQIDQYNLCTDQCTTSGHNTHLTYDREVETGRLTRSIATRDTAAPFNLQDLAYTYDHAGNITRIHDAVGPTTDTQCFTYDHLQRLRQAWTPSSGNCATAPTTGGLGGPAPYWLSWDINTIGNRTEQVDHKASGNVTTTYAYPAAGAARPHAVSSTTTGATTVSYAYDNAGNTTGRPVTGGAQTLTWDPEGRLATTSDPTGTTSYVYDADGNRLVRRDSGGRTLYLPGQEIRYNTATGTKSVTRFYSHSGVTVGSRTVAALSWLVPDHQGTNSISINATTNAVERRRQTPYGTLRGAAPTTWPNQKGFVGGDNDPTGLVHLGAREYDAAIGRFVTVDPVMDLSDPQQWNAYAYANNSPITNSDPSGLLLEGGGSGIMPGSPPPQAPAAPTPPPKKKKKKSLLGQVWEGYKRGYERVNVEPLAGIINVVKTGAELAYSNVTAAANGDKSWGDAFHEVMEYKAQIDMAIATSPLAFVKETVETGKATASAVSKGDWAGAVENAFVFTANVGSLFVPGGAGAATAKTIATGVAGAGKNIAANAAKNAAAKGTGGAARHLGGCNSFMPGTLVLMAGGGHKPIEQLVVGDYVVATDPETGQTATKEVMATIVGSGAKQLVDITVATGRDGETKTIVATDGHPFWVDSQATWQDAGTLRPGDELLTPDGARVRVIDIHAYSAIATVHNLTVANIHTYYVVAGDSPVLVHNANGTCGPVDPRPKFRKETVERAWNDAEPGPNGGRLCPTCGAEVKVPPGGGRRDWDIDHQPPWSTRTPEMRENPELTRAEVIADYQRGVRLECPTCNRSRGAR